MVSQLQPTVTPLLERRNYRGSTILHSHVSFAPGFSSLLNVLKPGAAVPFPLPPPPPSTTVFPSLGFSYLPDNLIPATFSLFFCLFLDSLVWVFWRSAICCPPLAASLSHAPTTLSIHCLLQLRCFNQIASGLPSIYADLFHVGFATFRPLLGFFCTPTVTSFYRALLCMGLAYI